jgi:predicted PhzF superfamily epimerase YddE/YHI9
MRAPITIVDAFTDRAFAGNPAAVCLLAEPAPEKWMQSVAAEMNLSETAFLVPQKDGFELRWFTPTVEVALCGHATLASAHVLWETERLPRNQIARFHTKSGWLAAERVGNAIQLDFPAKPARRCDPPPDLLPALNLRAEFVGQNGMDFLVVAPAPAAVRETNPEFGRLCTLGVRGIIVTAPSDDPQYDFVSRFFAPGSGILEDPATGSSHCCLGPYWAERLGKTELVGFQASRRTGVVRVRCAGDRVKLGGQAVTVVRGEITA